MCYTIDSENVLFNFFSFAESNEISYKTLRKLREKIEANFTYNVYVDITYNSLHNTVLRHSDLLEMENTKISCKMKLDETIRNLYNSKLPSNIQEDYIEFFSTLNAWK